MILFAPHRAHIYPPRLDVDGASRNVLAPVHHSGDPSATIPCKIEPLPAETAFAATGAEVQRPHRLQANLEWAPHLLVNALVVWRESELTFRVRAVREYRAFPDTSHVSAILEAEEVATDGSG